MIIEETKELEIHSFNDIPSVVLKAIKVLIDRKDEKTYIVIIDKRK